MIITQPAPGIFKISGILSASGDSDQELVLTTDQAALLASSIETALEVTEDTKSHKAMRWTDDNLEEFTEFLSSLGITILSSDEFSAYTDLPVTIQNGGVVHKWSYVVQDEMGITTLSKESYDNLYGCPA